MVMLAMMRTPDPNERSAAVLPPIMSARAGHMQQQAQEEAELRQDAALQQEMSFPGFQDLGLDASDFPENWEEGSGLCAKAQDDEGQGGGTCRPARPVARSGQSRSGSEYSARRGSR